MVNVKINGIEMRFTMGTLYAIAEANPEGDMLFPLTGLPNSKHGVYILYGALAAFDEKAERAPRFSLQDCEKLIRDFTGKQYMALIGHYNKLISVELDESDISKSSDDTDGPVKKK